MAASNITLTLGIMSLSLTKMTATETVTYPSNLCTGTDWSTHEPTPLQRPTQCPKCGDVTSSNVIVKGFKEGGTYRLVQADDIAEAKAAYTAGYKGKLQLVVHPASDFLLTTAPGQKVYYLTPSTGGDLADQYQLIVKLIESHPELAFVGLHTPSSLTGLYMVTVRDGVLLMQERVREDAVKPAPSVGGEAKEAMYSLVEMMLGDLITDYEPEAYEDKYALALKAMIEAGETVQMDTEKATPVATTNDELLAKLTALKAVA